MITSRFNAEIVAGGTSLPEHNTTLRLNGVANCWLQAAPPGTPFIVTLEIKKLDKIVETDFLAALFIDGNLIETVPIKREFVGTVIFEGKPDGFLLAPFIFTRLETVETHLAREDIVPLVNHNLGRIKLIVNTVILVEKGDKKRQRGEGRNEVREAVTESGAQYQQNTGSIYSEPPLTINQFDRESLFFSHDVTCITSFGPYREAKFPTKNSISNFRQVSAHEQKQVSELIFDYRWKCRWFEVDIDAVPRAEINVRYQLPPPLPRPTPLTDAEIKSNLEAEIQAAEEELKLNAGQHWARYNLLNARLILHQAQMATRDALSDYQRAQAEFDEAVESEVVRV